jgi:putative CocE/NonD family hydrolase
MNRRLFAAIFVSAIAAAVTPETRLQLRVPMRDRVVLRANLFRPPGDARFPTILVRTPYGKGTAITAGYQVFVDHGYAVLAQDVRGRYDSGGEFNSWVQEGPDGSDTLDWIARQSWSNGKVGMLGGSYVGIVQWKVALRNNPHLKAIFPVVSGYDDYRDRFYSTGGALKLGHRLSWMADNLRVSGFAPVDFKKYIWHLPIDTSDVAATGQRSDLYFQPAMAHPTYDELWKATSVREHLDKIKVPVFSVGGWYDNYAQSDLEAFSALRAASKQAYTAIGPWPHNMSIPFPGVDFGRFSHFPVLQVQLEWFDHWMKDKEFHHAPLKIFVMGRNEWRDEQEWPLRRARLTPLYFASKGYANTVYGNGELVRRAPLRDFSDQFTYDPRKPVQTLGGAVCCNPKIFPWGPMDQRPVEQRKDVLVYTSQPLKHALEVTGPIRVHVYVATSATDTDFTAKLVDVFPDGTARNLTDGLLRLRYRKSLEKPVLAVPGEVYAISIDAGVTSNVFLPEHRIRVEISSSNFPRFDRNLNTGGSLVSETEMRVAQQTVRHSRKYPSHILLPIVP